MQPLSQPRLLAVPIRRGLRQPGVVAWATALAVLAFVLLGRAGDLPYTPDSADYIEQARSLLRGENARVTPDLLEQASAEPTRLFPIGFPVVLAGLGILGIEPAVGALIVNGAAAILFPLLLLYLFAPLLSGPALSIVIFVSALTPGLLINARLALSDTFSVFLCVAAVGMLARRTDRVGFVAAGCLAGAAYAVRNANLALIIAFYACFVLESLAGRGRSRRVFTQAAWFTGGLCLFVIPSALRNVITFGEINPYQMPPSSIGFLQNTRMFLSAFVQEATASKAAATYLAWTGPGVVIAAVSLAAIIAWVARRLPLLVPDARRVALISLSVAALGALIVIAARSKYQWGELIGLRHTFPYVPFLAIGAGMLLDRGAAPSERRRAWATAAVAAAVLVFVVPRLWNYASNVVRFAQGPDTPRADALVNGETVLCGEPGDSVLLSNYAYVFRATCGAPVRDIWAAAAGEAEVPIVMESRRGALATYLRRVAERGRDRSLVLGLFPGSLRGIEPDEFPLDEVQRRELTASGYVILRNDRDALILERPPG